MARLSLEERQQNFIEAAVQVVANEGVARATTRRIAEAANAPLAGLHYCFRTKEELFKAVFEVNIKLGLEYICHDLTPGMGLHGAVSVILKAHYEWLRGNRSMQQAQLELCHWALRSPAYRHLVHDTYRDFVNASAELLREVRQPHEIGIDLEMLARHISAIADGHILQWLALDEKFGDAIEDAIRILQAKIAAQAPAPKAG